MLSHSVLNRKLKNAVVIVCHFVLFYYHYFLSLLIQFDIENFQVTHYISAATFDSAYCVFRVLVFLIYLIQKLFVLIFNNLGVELAIDDVAF